MPYEDPAALSEIWEWDPIERAPPMPTKHEAIVSSVSLPAVTDDTEQTLETTENHQVDATETERDAPSLPLHLTGVSLFEAASKGDVEAVRALLNANADVNEEGGFSDNALHAASWRGYEDVVELLLERGAEANARGGIYGNAVVAASACGKEGVVRLLLDNGADVNAPGGKYYGSALHVASSLGNEGMVRLLLDKGADVNALGGMYGSALQAASKNGREAVVRLLLENGAKKLSLWKRIKYKVQ